MKALSIRQPWCQLILFAGKDIENRSWQTNFRGPVLIHASKTFDGDAYDRREFLSENPDTEFGGIVGMIDIVDCVSQSNSPWFHGPFGFVLKNPKAINFIPCKGQLGFFTPPIDVLQQIQKELSDG